MGNEIIVDGATRRQFVNSIGVTPLVGALSAALSGSAQAQPPECAATPAAALIEPMEIKSSTGKLQVELTVTGADKNVPFIENGQAKCRTLRLRYYKGRDKNDPRRVWPPSAQVPGPGPTLRARVGDEVNLSLVNALNALDFPQTVIDDSKCDIADLQGGKRIYPGDTHDQPPSCFHGSNVTNLHFHGTHVSPGGTADNVMIDVIPRAAPLTQKQKDENEARRRNGLMPGYHPGQFDYKFTLTPPPSGGNRKMGQAPGTHWYHAHKHGSVAIQLLNGMAGAFIIEGAFDDRLRSAIPNLQEKVLVIQQFDDKMNLERQGGRTKPMLLVNGQLQPTITMRPGEIQRWRIIGALMQQSGASNFFFLEESLHASMAAKARADGSRLRPVAAAQNLIQFKTIARDGIQFAPQNYGTAANDKFVIAPGYRIDILVKAPSTPAKAVLARSDTANQPARRTLDQSVLLRVDVSGTPVNMSFPAPDHFPTLPPDLADIQPAEIRDIRTVRFNISPGALDAPTINNRRFDGTLDKIMLLNYAEEWILENHSQGVQHPFHIHVNPFQVIEIFDPSLTQQIALKPPYIWRDTIAIPEASNGTPGRVRIRQRFADFPGTFVLHCHILGHEDRGMMQLVQIVDPNDARIQPMSINPHH